MINRKMTNLIRRKTNMNRKIKMKIVININRMMTMRSLMRDIMRKKILKTMFYILIMKKNLKKWKLLKISKKRKF